MTHEKKTLVEHTIDLRKHIIKLKEENKIKCVNHYFNLGSTEIKEHENNFINFGALVEALENKARGYFVFDIYKFTAFKFNIKHDCRLLYYEDRCKVKKTLSCPFCNTLIFDKNQFEVMNSLLKLGGIKGLAQYMSAELKLEDRNISKLH